MYMFKLNTNVFFLLEWICGINTRKNHSNVIYQDCSWKPFIHWDRTGKYLYNNKSSPIQGVIQSLVSVEEFKKKKTLELYENVFEGPFLEMTGVLQVKSICILVLSLIHINKYVSNSRQEARCLLQECSVSFS